MNKYVRALGWELTLTAKSISRQKGERGAKQGGEGRKSAARKPRLEAGGRFRWEAIATW
jgi:hypothetical protein